MASDLSQIKKDYIARGVANMETMRYIKYLENKIEEKQGE